MCIAKAAVAAAPKRRGGLGHLGGRLGKPQVLQHQLGHEARLEAVARRRARHRARHRAHLAQDERAGRRGRHHVVERLAGNAQLLAHDERLGGRERDDAGHHVVADLGHLAEAGGAAVHDILAHALQQRQRLREHRLVAAAHEGERRGIRAGDSARYRCIQHGKAALGGGGVDGSRAFDVDGRAIDQHRSLVRRGDHALAQEHGAHVGAHRQHGDDEVDLLGRILHRCRALGARLDDEVHRLLVEVEHLQAVARPDQVARHQAAHVADADESHACHDVLSG